MSNSTFTSRPGAVGSPPEHYGNPFGEQRTLAAGESIVELADRAVITITGPDRLTWLDSLTTQSLAGLKPGESAETLLLNPNGRIEHAMRVMDDSEATWLLVDGSEREALAKWLDRMRFMLRVEIADRSDDFLTLGSFGDVSLPAAVSNDVPLVWSDSWASIARGGHQYSRAEQHPGANWRYQETLVSIDADLSDYAASGSLAFEALRIAAWRPRFSTEVDDRSLPHELDWMRSAVHLNKGCYRGQETVAKVHNLGHPPRRLVMLHLDGSEGALPEPGADVSLGEKVVGSVTASARHFELGPIALAVIKRGVDAAETLSVASDIGEIAAAQEVIVPTDAGAEANVPRLPRLGAVKR
ncbi:folate-binding protein YgfZ [Salinibacterium sp. M195]|uniref:CAF17-like 4Fe-4S cluster assembly/insertion protein YgfZ n=1 Tax=Salinibacterium sp. M195 TaxID=2583374 RepID=UPI002101ED09|nr:glycine cleavage T C-terminal barrel domain-containing protein [Salinibacterium sp. M195]